MTLEERCCAALTAVELEDYVGPDTFDQVLRSVMDLVERERASAAHIGRVLAPAVPIDMVRCAVCGCVVAPGGS